MVIQDIKTFIPNFLPPAWAKSNTEKEPFSFLWGHSEQFLDCDMGIIFLNKFFYKCCIFWVFTILEELLDMKGDHIRPATGEKL